MKLNFHLMKSQLIYHGCFDNTDFKEKSFLKTSKNFL